MSGNSKDSTTIVPDISGPYNDTGDAKVKMVENIFIPLITIDKTHNTDKCTYLGNLEDEVLKLSNFDKVEIPVETVKFTIKTKVKFKIEQGNKIAEKEEESIECVSNQVKMVNVIHNGQITKCSEYVDSSSNFILDKVKYGDTFEIEIEPYELYENSYNDAYILLRYYTDTSTADCGKVRFTNTSKVGKRLVTNIEGLPLAPPSYIKPPLWTDPQKSFNVANDYKNCQGMCFAVTMARVNKAYEDVSGDKPLELSNVKNMDYYISGTTAPSIPDTYLGYGVGGALANKGKGTLLTEDAVWEGKLEEGAILQYWNNPDGLTWVKMKAEIKKYTQNKVSVGYYGGHSIIFKTYQYDDLGNVTGFKYYDYGGTNRSAISFKDNIFQRGTGRVIVLGVNLID